MKISAIICAAGKGERANLGKNKLLYPFHGANALYYTVKKFIALKEYLSSAGDCLCDIIVTSSPDDFEEISAFCVPLSCKVVLGGNTRMQSVYNALEFAGGEMVIIHDGARPYTQIRQFAACLDLAKSCGAAVLAMPVTDTIAVQKEGFVADIPERSSLYAVQTPQIFDAQKLKAAYGEAIKSGENFTDDGSVYSRFCGPVKICGEGSAANKKLTYGEDFSCPEEGLLNKLTATGARIGLGVDVHAFGKSAPFIMLCGVKIPCGRELAAHSDGDVALHAVMDALLSAAGLNDIGHYFPDSDEKYRGADSGKLLGEVIKIIGGKGFVPLSLSLSIQAEEPRLAPYIARMKERVASLAGISANDVAIAAGTCEGLGFVGEKLGIAAYCACSLGYKKSVKRDI